MSEQMAPHQGLSRARTSARRSTLAYLAFVCAQAMSGQAQSTSSPRGSESEEVRRLTEQVAAQADKLAAQAKQIDAQQSDIKTLQSAFVEQKALLDKLVHSDGTALPVRTVVASTHQPAITPAIEPALPGANPSAMAQAAPILPETAQSTALKQEQKEQPYVKEPTHWYDKISERGYMQMRENNIVNTNPLYTCDQCDKSIGPNNTFFLRRMRLVLSGNISDHVAFYFQPDFASASDTSQNYAQIRDAYFDVSFDEEKKNRIRFGLSKIPYGFDDLQSSQNRLSLDRADAINSAAPNERDIGAFYYWARPYIRARFNELVSSGLKGSGDYGEAALGIYNGQGLNNPSVNSYFHYVARYTYPFKLRNGQFIETSIQGYTGKYTVTNVGTAKGQSGLLYNDQRLAVSLIVYPQPLGFQAEYNWGTGPQYNPKTNYIAQHALDGGYALLNYRLTGGPLPSELVIQPYARFTYYNGGKKFELDARRYLVYEGDFGIEAQFGKYIEFTPQYTYGYRTFEDSKNPTNRQLGSLLRLQMQFNY